MKRFRVKTHGDMHKWYILQERVFLIFWKTHYRFYDNKEDVQEDIDFLNHVKLESVK